VVGAGPGHGVRHDPGVVAHDLARDAFDPLGHLGRGATGKRHQQDPAGVGTLDDQMRDPMGKGVGLSGSAPAMTRRGGAAKSPGGAVLDSPLLLRIKSFEVGGRRLHFGWVHPCRNRRRSMIPAVIATF
jgi:hypothetical protein